MSGLNVKWIAEINARNRHASSVPASAHPQSSKQLKTHHVVSRARPVGFKWKPPAVLCRKAAQRRHTQLNSLHADQRRPFIARLVSELCGQSPAGGLLMACTAMWACTIRAAGGPRARRKRPLLCRKKSRNKSSYFCFYF